MCKHKFHHDTILHQWIWWQFTASITQSAMIWFWFDSIWLRSWRLIWTYDVILYQTAVRNSKYHVNFFISGFNYTVKLKKETCSFIKKTTKGCFCNMDEWRQCVLISDWYFHFVLILDHSSLNWCIKVDRWIVKPLLFVSNPLEPFSSFNLKLGWGTILLKSCTSRLHFTQHLSLLIPLKGSFT